ncbi:MAG: hypothetical protein AMJ89_00035 [candidate division Zixibacteria bacterium SM23_73]|nr:MAG: hypothetical protein AMJ89_00035 [candidate division Zixibacteria bacterium SM23_73]
MSFSVGIVGLPNVGKSTLFKSLTKKEVDIGPFPFTTIKPNHGIVLVPDIRLQKIAEVIKPEKITPTIIEFVDIAGLVKNAYKGEGLGNQFLAQIRNCDAICEVVRAFKADKIKHVQGEIDPKRDIEIIKTELLMKDLETLESIILKLEKKKDPLIQKKLQTLQKVKNAISKGIKVSEIQLTSEEKKEIKELQLLTEKPVFYIVNVGSEKKSKEADPSLKINLKIEEEALELSSQDIQELDLKTQIPEIILSCYKILDLITFYTIAGGKETRAWTLKRNSTAPQAGNIVHSDFKEKFIKAEVIDWKDLLEIGSWKTAREKGVLKTVGKDYIVQDGDVIEFKI